MVPPEADTAEIKSIKIRDTGQDNVLAWLSDNSMVLSRVNNEGWCGVVCPNHAEHSDGGIEGRYKPLDRSLLLLPRPLPAPDQRDVPEVGVGERWAYRDAGGCGTN